ncbi:hypothetical protein TrCOL_g1436 [Triparma columacea]|uniref:Calmodulin-lysine N-methyltransferase n=1 Tax=Triparma columacea TaxID=722753 RepID=A0A9W7GFY6_9STRA|nr:hypothetical protein TrCOL_g1436 [Triparma columacea]
MRLIRRAVILKSLTSDKRKYIKVTTITYPPGLSNAQSLGAVMKSESSPSSNTTDVWVLLNLDSPSLPFTSADLLCDSTIKSARFKDDTSIIFRSCTSTPTRTSLTSNLTHGCDNTGQTRIWECATLTLRYLLSKYDRTQLGELLELGCGMVGFAGLYSGGLITDGHSSGVFNNLINLELNNSQGSATRLLWDSGSVGYEVCKSIGGPKFDTIVVADCVHFKDFHDALACTIGRLLKVGGRAVLVQPRRGGSLAAFNRVVVGSDDDCDSCLNWVSETAETADFDVWRGHVNQEHGGYREDAHLPVYVEVRKRREWREDDDGGGVRRRAGEEMRKREEERRERILKGKGRS